jgi:hypothetical protein
LRGVKILATSLQLKKDRRTPRTVAVSLIDEDTIAKLEESNIILRWQYTLENFEHLTEYLATCT